MLQQIEIEEPGRLDRVLAEALQISRSRCQQWIRAGFVQVDEITVCKPSRRLAGGEWVEVESQETPASTLQPDPTVQIDVVHETDDWLVLHKKAGQLVHPGAGRHDGTLAAGMLAKYPILASEFAGSDRPGVIHRLDMGTSGLLVWALKAATRDWFGEQFALRKVGKWYLAWLQGDLKVLRKLEAPIRRSSRDRTRFTSRPGRGHTREAITSVTPLLQRELDGQSQTLCVIRIFTGRTHQIRVHCADAGFAVVGDAMYGSAAKGDPMLLHAWRLELPAPDTEEKQLFMAPPPSCFGIDSDTLADWQPDAEGEAENV